ncbi:hypothetical protein [Clostridium luticellarii]|nr:hypothetical protein [Clostridium luticellarii]MCI1944751.1 hypothetical protein [Clostridium luticellarii]MCI1968246.1 hypothetical protein [Clostridium luticellarii]
MRKFYAGQIHTIEKKCLLPRKKCRADNQICYSDRMQASAIKLKLQYK